MSDVFDRFEQNHKQREFPPSPDAVAKRGTDREEQISTPKLNKARVKKLPSESKKHISTKK